MMKIRQGHMLYLFIHFFSSIFSANSRLNQVYCTDELPPPYVSELPELSIRYERFKQLSEHTTIYGAFCVKVDSHLVQSK